MSELGGLVVKTKRATSYGWSIVTMRIYCTVMEI